MDEKLKTEILTLIKELTFCGIGMSTAITQELFEEAENKFKQTLPKVKALRVALNDPELDPPP